MVSASKDDEWEYSRLDSKLEPYEYAKLPEEKDYVRIIVLHPSPHDDLDSDKNHVSISFSVEPLDEVKPYIAVKNSRGYRMLNESIEVDGRYLFTALSVEKFLRHFRRSNGQSLRLWLRFLCLQQGTVEQDRYWKRSFVDNMYERAEEVVDMAAFNSELVDKKKTKRIYDSRYFKVEKRWGSFPEKIPLPKVFAIKLGNMPVPDEPPKTYEYVPLDAIADEIRVVVVKGALETGQKYEAGLAHLAIRSEVPYTGVSWNWGPFDQQQVEIIVNGQKTQIWENLANLLSDIQMPDAQQSLWIDALCINQKDTSERNRQLKRMAEIYYNAAGVLCYIGRPDQYSDIALDFVPVLQQPMMKRDENGEWYAPGQVSNATSKQHDPNSFVKGCAVLYKLLTRPYFRRIWVVQEVAVSSNPTIFCGSRVGTPFESLDTATYNLQDMLRSDPRWPQRMRELIPELADTTIHEEELEYLRVMFYFRHLHSNGNSKDSLFQMCRIDPKSPGLLETAVLTRKFKSSVPHDKIFALWNLAWDKDGFDFQMNYDESYTATFTDFARSWAMFSGSLDVIGTAEASPLSERFYVEAPTWSTDWSQPSLTSCFVRREKLPKTMMRFVDSQDGPIFAADGCMSQKNLPGRYFDFDGDVLSCTGIILDSIKLIFEDAINPPEGWRFHPPDLMSHWKAHLWGNELQNLFIENRLITYDDPLQAAWAMFHSDDPEVWPLKAENLENADDERFPDEIYVCLPNRAKTRHGQAAPQESRLIPWYGGDYSRTVAWEAVNTTLRGRIPVLTENGYMGLVPRLIKDEPLDKPLSIAILATCTVPVLLMDLGNGAYQFRGTCFVQGWMNGSMLTSQMGVDTAEEFWHAMQGVDRLRII